MEHIKRCYLIPVVVSIALFFLNGFAFVFLSGGGIEELLYTPVELAVVFAAVILFYIGIAESILAIINRRTVTSAAIGIAFLVFAFFAILKLPYPREFIFILFFVGTAGAVSAFINGRTTTAIVSGIAVLVPFLLIVLGIAFDAVFHGVATGLIILFFTGGGILAGGGTLAVAFIMRTNMALSKLKALYLVPPILLIPIQLFFLTGILDSSFIVKEALFFTGVSILTVGGFLAVAFIAHSNMELYKKSLYSILPILLTPFLLFLFARWSLNYGFLLKVKDLLWELLQHMIVGGCIIMGINRIIYPNDSNIDPRKDSLEL